MSDTATTKMGKAPKTPVLYEGATNLNKSTTNAKWKEFGGDNSAVDETDGSKSITRIVEHESKTNKVSMKLTEKLTRNIDGYGTILWQLSVGATAGRSPAKNKYDENWQPSILAKIREVVADGVTVLAASKALANELGISHNTIRANIWVADKWAKGETVTFLPHRSLVKPICDLLCELGKKDMMLASLNAYCAAVENPNKSVTDVLDEYRK